MSEQIKIAVDTHTHTLASGHAYNTIREMAACAAKMGLEGLAITEHAPEMPGSCHLFYFQNLRVVPREMYGIELLLGTELNILDENGTLDLPGDLVKDLDISIASMHSPCYGKSRGLEKNMQAYCRAMACDYVDIIGHPDDGRFELDYEELVDTARRTGTILELNNSSLKPGGFRVNTWENDVKMLRICKKCGVMVVLGSDAHVDADIANTLYSSKALREADFPEQLIANTSLQKLKASLKRNR